MSNKELNEKVARGPDKVGFASGSCQPLSPPTQRWHETARGDGDRHLLNPKVIIADEPTSALDVVVQKQVMLTLSRLQQELNAAVLLIGHDMGLITQFADTIGVLYAGKLVERGRVADVLENPLPSVHPPVDRQPARPGRQARLVRHPRPAARAAAPAHRLRLPPALPVCDGPLPQRNTRRFSRRRRTAGSLPPVSRSIRIACPAIETAARQRCWLLRRSGNEHIRRPAMAELLNVRMYQKSSAAKACCKKDVTIAVDDVTFQSPTTARPSPPSPAKAAAARPPWPC